MGELKKYYKVTDGSCYCVVETLEEAQDICDWNDGDYLLEIVEEFMTEEEFNNLPEFDGF